MIQKIFLVFFLIVFASTSFVYAGEGEESEMIFATVEVLPAAYLPEKDYEGADTLLGFAVSVTREAYTIKPWIELRAHIMK